MRYVICQHMGWDYYTYEKQPPHFIEEIVIFMTQESNKQKLDMKKSSGNSANMKSKGVSRFG
jgi:hypothetical protein